MQHCGETCLQELAVITIKLHNGCNRLELMSHWQPEQLVKFLVRSNVLAASTDVVPAYVVYCFTLSLSLQVCGLRALTAMIWMYVLLKPGAPATFFCPISFKLFRDPGPCPYRPDVSCLLTSGVMTGMHLC